MSRRKLHRYGYYKFHKKHGYYPRTYSEDNRAFHLAVGDNSFEAYFWLQDEYTTLQARQAAIKHVEGYKDYPRFDNPENNELLKRNGRRYWSTGVRDKRITEWIIKHGTRKKYVSAIARAVQLSEAACLSIYNNQVNQAWVAYAENESE